MTRPGGAGDSLAMGLAEFSLTATSTPTIARTAVTDATPPESPAVAPPAAARLALRRCARGRASCCRAPLLAGRLALRVVVTGVRHLISFRCCLALGRPLAGCSCLLTRIGRCGCSRRPGAWYASAWRVPVAPAPTRDGRVSTAAMNATIASATASGRAWAGDDRLPNELQTRVRQRLGQPGAVSTGIRVSRGSASSSTGGRTDGTACSSSGSSRSRARCSSRKVRHSRPRSRPA